MEADPKRWNNGRSAYISINPGIRAHCRLLSEILKHLIANEVLDPQLAIVDEINLRVATYLEPFIDWLKSTNDDEVKKRFGRKFGEGGVTEYYFGLCEILSQKFSNIGGEEYKNYISRKKDERAKLADESVNDLQLLISKVVIDSLKQIYGTKDLESGEKAYWELGIENSEIKQAAYKKQQQNPPEKRALKEAYLDLIDFEKIIRQKKNWERFKPIFSIPMRGVNPKSKEYHLDWLNELNEVRRIAAHKSQFRVYKNEDYDFIDWLKTEIYDRCSSAGLQVT